MYFTVLTKRKMIALISLALAIILLMSIVFAITSKETFAGLKTRQLPIYRVETDDKKIAISFDCAWGVDYTDKLLQIMQDQNIKCTFFAVEFWVKKHPDYVKKISDLGHEIGTHSATHPYMSKLTKEEITKELLSSKGAIENITGKTVQLFRPPYGDYDDLLIETAKELGLYTIQWDVDSLDWKDLSAKDITDRVLNRVKNGSIVLFHNQGLHTSKAIETIIKELKQQGYEFVSIGELIYKQDYHMLADGTQIKNN
ncbi:MAG: deacetylase [Clostridiales bacterium]|nr:deacetylase [Clostridiales bacterium]